MRHGPVNVIACGAWFKPGRGAQNIGKSFGTEASTTQSQLQDRVPGDDDGGHWNKGHIWQDTNGVRRGQADLNIDEVSWESANRRINVEIF